MDNVAVIGASPKQERYSNKAIYDQLKKAGIDVVEACTLVLLKTNQY